MKNLKSFPFERNRYFYGKLLSVEDFETEQKYFNNKRRTINRFLFGSGVVCGLGVVEVDDESISVERGLALDFFGREIILDEPAVRRISELEGYGGGQEEDFYYLCLEYQEEAAELMHNVTGTRGQNSSEYNKYKEGYRLFLTQEEPEREIFSTALYEERKTVFSGYGVKIRHILPKFLEAGRDTALKIEVEYNGQLAVSFEYDLELSFLTGTEGNRVHVSFVGNEFGKAEKSTFFIPLKIASAEDVKAKADLVRDSFKLRIGDREYTEVRPCVSQASVNGRDVYEALQETYYKTAMDDIEGSAAWQSIYLAKIYVVRAGELSLIERIEPLPFEQKIMHTEISSAMIHKLTEDVRELKEEERLKQQKQREREEETPVKAAYGETVFEIGHARPGKVLYSDEIVHGLGFGPVTIVLGYEVDDKLLGDEQIIFGDATVFQGQNGFAASLGARLMPSEGTFEIALKILKNNNAKRVRVYWSALRNKVQKSESVKKKHIYIQPDNPNIYTGDTIVFSAVLEGFSDDRLVWSVRDQNGGTIDKTGKYTAPETAGIFQITVSSTAFPKVSASTFVMVREKV